MKECSMHGKMGGSKLRGLLDLFLSRPLLQFTFIAVIAVIAYSDSFHGGFVFDDESSIVTNKVIHGLSSFFTDGAGYSYNPRRFVGYLSFALNYQFGGLDVIGYHVANLGIHIINALLVYCLVRLTLRTPFFKSPSSIVPRSLSLVPLLTSLLFAVHPVQTEAVTYIVQRLASLTTLFYLTALVLHICWRLALEAGSSPTSRRVLPYYLLSFAAAVLAMKTKETAFTLPIIVLLYELYFFGRPGWKRLASLGPILLTMAIIPLSMVNIHKPIGDVLSDVSKTTVVQTTLSRYDYLLTQFRVIVTYLRLLFLPVRQNLDYDYPLYHTLFTPPVFLSFLFLLALAGLAAYLLYRSGQCVQHARHNKLITPAPAPYALRLVSFGIFWFFITLSVESSFIPIVDVIFEHRLYLPSVGFFIALVTSCWIIREWCRERVPTLDTLLWAASSVIVVALTGATYARNLAWQDNLTIWQDAVAKSPVKIRPLNNLGAALNDSGRPREAMTVLEKAITVKPDHPEAYYNLGRSYQIATQEFATARDLYLRAIMLKPDYTDAYINLGGVYIRMGRFGEAIGVLEQAKGTTKVERPDLLFNLGVAYVSLGNTGAAERVLSELRRVNPVMAQQLEDYISMRGRAS